MIVTRVLERSKGGGLLVALDFDGTLSEIVDHPDLARPVAGAVEVLDRLAALADTTVAVVSGRSRAELVGLVGEIAGVTLVAEHGAVWSGDAPAPPDGLEELAAALETVVDRHTGVWLERKQTSLVVHVRHADDEAAAVADVVSCLDREGHHRWEMGKKVIDVRFVDESKGSAVHRLRTAGEHRSVLFVGDDTTDESVFALLGPDDVGVKVGEGDTAAEFRVGGPTEVVALLEALAERRRSDDRQPGGGR